MATSNANAYYKRFHASLAHSLKLTAKQVAYLRTNLLGQKKSIKQVYEEVEMQLTKVRKRGNNKGRTYSKTFYLHILKFIREASIEDWNTLLAKSPFDK